MRIQPLSDLHLEFDEDQGERFALSLPVLGDVLVLGGDIVPLRRRDHVRKVLGWFCSRFPEIVYVPGNHEYYRTSPAWGAATLAACARGLSNLHVLDPGVAEIGGIRFVAATLWFPLTPDEETYRGVVADFALIRDFVPWVHQTHAAQLAFLEQTIRPGDVVITHHVPHPRSIAPQYAGDPLNRFFVAEDAAPLLERSGARLWIHGHTHVSFDYRVGDTRVICNARGYPGEPGTSLNPELVIEV
ncbi:MAG TPA: metallophosphoesterase [Myxococcaceae bacterium]|nr:metallophosphoesterase [Myxococcaceae bacterium]